METQLSTIVTTQNSIDSVELFKNPGDFTVKFWGVRGSVPTPGKETVRYGGNTSCIEMQIAGKRRPRTKLRGDFLESCCAA